MSHRSVEVEVREVHPSLNERVIKAWGGRAKIRRNLAIAATDAVMMTVAFQIAFPDFHLEESAVLITGTRILMGIGIWLSSRAVLRFTGEVKRDEAEVSTFTVTETSIISEGPT